MTFGAETDDFRQSATLEITDPRCFAEIAFGGSIGAGEAFMQGFWHSADLVAVVRILLRNRDVLEGMDSGTARLTRPVQISAR